MEHHSAQPLVLITGVTGFLGRALCMALARSGRQIRGAIRAFDAGSPLADVPGFEGVPVGPISEWTDWTLPLRDVEAVIHLAARTHQADVRSPDALPLYREENVETTKRLAEMAAAAGVQRFVFMSSVKVNGESTVARPFTETDTPNPEDAYGRSKHEAEDALRHIEAMTGMEVVIIRPPLVYGPGVKGNFLRLMRLVARGIPLPLASISNQRSLVYLGNLVDAVITCIDSSAAAGKTYLVSDGEDVSTPALIRRLAEALGRHPRLFRCPQSLLALAATLTGKQNELARLTGSLQVDNSRIRSELGWEPRFSIDEGLAETARWFLGNAADH